MDDYNMTMVQGDTLCLSVEVEGLDGDITGAEFLAKMDLDGDVAICKDYGNGIEYAGREDDTWYYNVQLDPEDTENLPTGQYYYQLKIALDSNIFTVLKGILKIERNIGYV